MHAGKCSSLAVTPGVMRLSIVCPYRKALGSVSDCRPGHRFMLGSAQGILRALQHNCAHLLPRRGISHFPPLRMRLIQFQSPASAGQRIGLELEGEKVIDLTAFHPSLPCRMREFLEGGEETLQIAKRALDSGQHILSRSQLSILSPITNPEKVICVGMNYVDHCLEQNVPVPKEPIIFSKFSSSIVGPYDSIVLPAESQEVDWEVELAFIIGKRGKNIKEQDAMEHVAGFTVAHDVSARDWQMKKNGKQWLLGKTFDTFCPMGPALVTKDSISDPHSLGIRCRVNGNLVQDSNTNQMVFKTEALIAWVSKRCISYWDPPWSRCIPETTSLP
ncbi:fumarylacetoacetate hydrolase domain-containing protein 2 isoform X2 [Hyla sarda]|uniref:fumarylacetoacetate hydrolase domain-containing protein 2 isoform X2 n=1 Tax=Hyla sarda TaxID=327740 RepID=UPI0024C44035|nr:fumarylacetoacetate hydrolase domain-containing protein 2 isoform X2 [Hyla sarda]